MRDSEKRRKDKNFSRIGRGKKGKWKIQSRSKVNVTKNRERETQPNR